MTRLETERLVLREFELSDVEDVLTFGSNPKVLRYTHDSDPVATIEDARRIITDTWHADYHNHGYGRLAVVDKHSERVIGFCGLKYLDDLKEIDIGYRLLPDYWGRGLATEAGFAVIDHGHNVLGIREIIGLVDPRNLASHRVLEKLNFQQAEQIEVEGIGVVQVYRELV